MKNVLPVGFMNEHSGSGSSLDAAGQAEVVGVLVGQNDLLNFFNPEADFGQALNKSRPGLFITYPGVNESQGLTPDDVGIDVMLEIGVRSADAPDG